MTKVKICGITSLKDAQAALKSGADALGFIFAKSPRQIDPKAAREIVDTLGPFITYVGVFVNATADKILKTASTARLDALQLHGEESPETCKKLGPYKIIKTFRMGDLFSSLKPQDYKVDAFLFDTAVKNQYGGTGRTWEWEKFPYKRLTRPVIVSGGLTPLNVHHAIKMLKPYAVDVSSGVEAKPGVKDHKLVEKFIQNAKQAS